MRMTSMVSRIRMRGRSKGSPWSPSTTWGPEFPSPRRNRPSLTVCIESAVMAVLAAVRAQTCMMPVPSFIFWVRAARKASGEIASMPQASALQAWSMPSFSASQAYSSMDSK